VCPDRRGQKCARTTPSWCPCQRRRTQHRDRAAVRAQRCSQGEGRGTGALRVPGRAQAPPGAPRGRARQRGRRTWGLPSHLPPDVPSSASCWVYSAATSSTWTTTIGAPRPTAVERQANALTRPKADSVRTVALPEALLPALRGHLETYTPAGSTAPVLAGQRGARLSRTALDSAGRAAREETPGRRRSADRRPRGVARRPRHPADPSPAPQARPRRNPTQPGTRHQARRNRRLSAPSSVSGRQTADAERQKLRTSQRQAERDRLHERPSHDVSGPSR
jgi:hypothetical protein